MDWGLFWNAFSAISTFAAFVAAGVAVWYSRMQLLNDAARSKEQIEIQERTLIKASLAKISIDALQSSITLSEWDASPTRDYKNTLTHAENMMLARSEVDKSYFYASDFVSEAYCPYALFPPYPVFIIDLPLKITNHSGVPCQIGIDSSRMSKDDIICPDEYNAVGYPDFIVGDDDFSSYAEDLNPIYIDGGHSLNLIVRRLVFAGQLIPGQMDSNWNFIVDNELIKDEDHDFFNFMTPVDLTFIIDNLTDDGKRVYQFQDSMQWNAQLLSTGIHILALKNKSSKLVLVANEIKNYQNGCWKRENVGNELPLVGRKKIEISDGHFTVD